MDCKLNYETSDGKSEEREALDEKKHFYFNPSTYFF